MFIFSSEDDENRVDKAKGFGDVNEKTSEKKEVKDEQTDIKTGLD